MEAIAVLSGVMGVGTTAISAIFSILQPNRRNRKSLPRNHEFLQTINLSAGDTPSETGQMGQTQSRPRLPLPSTTPFVSLLMGSDICICVEQDNEIFGDDELSTKIRGLFSDDPSIWLRSRGTADNMYRLDHGFASLSEQWTNDDPDVAWGSSSFLIGGTGHHSTKKKGSFGLFSGEQSEFSGIGGSETFGMVLIRAVKRVWIYVHPNTQHLTMIVSCLSQQNLDPDKYLNTPSRTAVRYSLQDYVATLSSTSCRFRPFLLDEKMPISGKRKVLLLWHCIIQLHTWMKSIATIRERYVDVRVELVDSRNLAMRPHLVNEISNDAYIYKELSSNAKQFIGIVQSLLHSIDVSLRSANIDHLQQPLSELLSETQGLCSSLTFEVDQMSNDLEHHLRFLELRRGVRESNSLWMLSILASVFLPLSLASGILSMGTRFTDLGVLLYDFCGVSVLLITLVGLLIGFTRILLWSHEKWADSTAATKPLLKGILMLGPSVFIASFWGLTLSSFIVGMAQDPSLGGRILGFGMAGLVGTSIVSLLGLWSVYKGVKLLLG